MVNPNIFGDSPEKNDDWRYMNHDDMSGVIAAFCFGTAEGETFKSASAALNRWVVNGLPVTVRKGERFYSYGEVVQHMISASLEGVDTFYFASRVQLLRAEAARLRRKKMQSKDISLTRTFFLNDRSQTKLRLKIPAPLSNDATILKTMIDPDIPGSSQRRIPGRIEITIPALNQSKTLAVTAAFKLQDSVNRNLPNLNAVLSYDLTDSKLLPYLSADIGGITIDDSWRAFSKSIARAEDGTFAAVKAFWHWLARNGRFSVIDQSQWQPKSWLEQNGEPFFFDCFAGSSFLIALCRAQGIPSRLVGGYNLSRPFPGPHYWLEVLAADQEWLPFDVSGWELAHGDIEDEHWLDWYFGQSEGRMATEIFPHSFVGPIGVPIPDVWTYYPSCGGTGLTTTICDQVGRKIFSDTISIGDDL